MASPFQTTQRREKEDQVQMTERERERERFHALVVGTSISPSFIIDYGASRHMVSTKEAFSSLDKSKGPSIVLGDDSLTESMGKVG